MPLTDLVPAPRGKILRNLLHPRIMGPVHTPGYPIARRIASIGLAALCLASTGGCQAIKDLRDTLQGRESPDNHGSAGITVTVEPADGITILLDGVPVGKLSPYTSQQLPSGTHLLEVRAPGYHPFKLPVQLRDGETLEVPVHLRRRTGNDLRAQPPIESDSPAAPLAPEVPPGVKTIPLVVNATPAAPVSLDGAPLSGKALELTRVRGTIGVGPATLPYEIGSRGLLFFTVPNDGATWRKEGRGISAGTRFRHNKGILRLERVDAEGALRILIKR